MAGVNVPQQQAGITKTILPTAGTVVGGYFGGPAGAMAGGLAGQKLAGGAKPGPQGVQSNAIQRRLDAHDAAAANDPQKDLAAATDAVQYLPPDLQKQYAPALAEAQRRAAMGGNT